MEDDRIQLLFMGRKDGVRTPGFEVPRTLPCILTETTEYVEEPTSDLSPSSVDTSSSSAGSSNRDSSLSSSHRSSASTAPSTAPSGIPPPPVLHIGLPNSTPTTPPPNPEHVLRCEFFVVGCEARFHPDNYHDYVLHSISHFQNHPPPTKSLCIFCDECDAEFENVRDPEAAWQERMAHISNHLQGQIRFAKMRPDFFVIDYMGDNKLLDPKDYTKYKRFTERSRPQRCPHLLPAGTKLEEVKRKEEKKMEERHDLEKERRIMMKREKIGVARG